ncbi:Major strawberry allergen Fra a 1-2 [Heracleum sosnowskyi]|uniref:Major strawberry allergen Fra a 1-2 n=1 Tax=Heracleum sosnowskyi TaxID=360622 RepID=A0AAD8MZ46_9APIA|nr:Major strawberry allergen Fra a 1-2 [Heracleum sosnowskyi]
MGAITTNVEVESSVPAQTIYKGFLLDMDNILPKILPQAIKSLEIISGDGGVGTIKKITLGEVSQFTIVKQRIDEIDREGLRYSYSIIEGDILMGIIESIASKFTVVPTEGGCIFKNTTVYTPIGDAVIPEENVKEATEQSGMVFKAVEAYLLANPGAY